MTVPYYIHIAQEAGSKNKIVPFPVPALKPISHNPLVLQGIGKISVTRMQCESAITAESVDSKLDQLNSDSGISWTRGVSIILIINLLVTWISQ